MTEATKPTKPLTHKQLTAKAATAHKRHSDAIGKLHKVMEEVVTLGDACQAAHNELHAALNQPVPRCEGASGQA